MKLDLNENDKKIISRLLIYDRKSKHITQNDYYLNHNGIPICALSTYRRIENYEIVHSDDIYEEFLMEKFNKKYCYDDIIDNLLDKLISSLYRCTEYYDMQKILSIISTMENLFIGYEEYILPSMYLECIGLIEKSYYKDPIDMNVVYKYIELYKVFPEKFQEVMKNYLFKTINTYVDSIDEINKLADKLELKNTKCSYNMLNSYFLEYYNFRMITPYSKILNLKKHFKCTDNYNLLIDVYTLELVLLTNFEKSAVRPLLREIDTFLKRNKEKINGSKFKQIMYNSSTIYMHIGYYKEAYNGFMYCLKSVFQPDYFLPTAIYCNYICTLTRKTVKPIFCDEDKDISIYPKRYQNLYNFYLLKNKHSECFQLLEDYMVKKVLPFTDKEDSLLNILIKSELTLIVKETGHKNLIRKVGKIDMV